MSSPYAKLPENSIRLFHLLPASDPFSSISGLLLSTSLKDPPTYNALSYEWGAPPSPPFTITIGSSTIHVSQNCYAALLRLRHPTLTRILWIDAICINQGDAADKNQQLPLMAAIYLNAESVVVWLGESTPATDGALAWCEHVSRMSFHWPVAKFNYKPNLLRARERRRVAAWFKERGAAAALRARSCFIRHEIPYPSQGLYDLLTRGWFARTWTIQEVALASAPVIMCGEKTILWGNLMGGFDVAFQRENNDTTRFARSAAQCIEILWLRLLERSWDESDARFYRTALRLFDAGSTAETVRRLRLFTETCVNALFVLGASMALYRFHTGHWRLENSDWDAWLLIVVLFSFLPVLIFLNPPIKLAQGRHHHLRESLINTINLVRLRGASDLRDKVFALYSTYQALGIPLDAPEYAHSTIAGVYSRFAERIIEWQGNLDILIEASLPAWQGTPTWVPDMSREYPRWEVQHFRATGTSTPDFVCENGRLRTTGLLLDVVERFWAVKSERKFGFVTGTKGYQGLTPGPVQVDDRVVLIAGLRVPMVLREVGSDYQVVGMAEVEGIMKGEAWDDGHVKTVFNLV